MKNTKGLQNDIVQLTYISPYNGIIKETGELIYQNDNNILIDTSNRIKFEDNTTAAKIIHINNILNYEKKTIK